MNINLEENIIRVVVLAINGLYTQIYDELYCTKENYNRLLLEFGNSSNYKVVTI